jgi:glyoxylase-like metal-dependent hydrolase (beta-lactamase superfamily II)
MRPYPAIVAVCVLGASSASAQRGAAPDPIVREGVTVKLGDHTYAIPDGNVGGVPNVGIVVGTRATLVIDPGLGRRSGEAVLREMSKVSRNSEIYIASTHFHPEHTTGYVAFPASAKYINSRVQEEEFAESGPALIQVFASRTPAQGELLKDAVQRKADILFDREYTLDLGGVQVRFLGVGPTHTKGDTGLFVEGDNALFAGDVVMNTSFVAANAMTSSMKAWLAACDAFDAMHPRVLVPSHGPIGDGSLIPTLRTVLQAIQVRTRELKAQGRPVDEIASTVQMEFQARYPTWARANGVSALARAAFRETP